MCAQELSSIPHYHVCVASTLDVPELSSRTHFVGPVF